MRIRDSPRPRAAGLDGLGRLRPRRRTTGRASGPRPTSPSPPARSAPGCTPGACAGSRSSAGPSAAAISPPSTATRCRASTSPGAPGPASSRRSCERVREGAQAGLVVAALPPSRQRADRARPAWSTACAATSWSRARVERGAPARARWSASSRCKAQAVIVTSGGIGGNHDLVRQSWPKRLGEPPRAHDLRRARPRRRAHARHHRGRRRQRHQPRPHVALHRGHRRTGARSGPRHGIRILPGPSSLWLDARGRRLPVPLFPGFDTLGTLAHIMADRLRLLLVRAQPEDHRARVRAVGLRAEPRPHQRQLAQGDPRARAAAVRRRRCGPSWRRAPTSSSSATWPTWSRA